MMRGYVSSAIRTAGDFVSVPADYDLNAVMDALAAVFDGTPTGETFGGAPETFSAYSEVPGQVSAPAIVLDLDDLQWDLTMGGGEDGFTVIGTLLLDFQDGEGAQRRLRAMLSRSGGLGKLKKALSDNQTLGELISYAHMTRVRRIGEIPYGDITYLGAEIEIAMVS